VVVWLCDRSGCDAGAGMGAFQKVASELRGEAVFAWGGWGDTPSCTCVCFVVQFVHNHEWFVVVCPFVHAHHAEMPASLCTGEILVLVWSTIGVHVFCVGVEAHQSCFACVGGGVSVCTGSCVVRHSIAGPGTLHRFWGL